MGCCSKFYHPNNNKVLKDFKNNIAYSFKNSKNIIDRYTSIFIEVNNHRLDMININDLFDEIEILMNQIYKVIDYHSFKRIILLSVIKYKSEVVLNSELYRKSFFYLNNNVNK